jgi:hypothetical protein
MASMDFPIKPPDSSKRKVPMKMKERPYVDTLRPEKTTGKLSGSLVEPSGRKVEVSAPMPHEETSSSPAEDHNPGNPGRRRPFAVSKSYDVYNGHAGDAASGVIESQPEGRAGLPPASAVTEAKVEPGVAVRCAKEQTGLNRYPINSHEQEHHTHGPNN